MEYGRPSLKLIEIPMYIGATLYILIGLAVIGFSGLLMASANGGGAIFAMAMMVFTAFFAFALGGFMIYATNQLKHRKKWAWITAIVFGAMFTPSAFIFLGIPILIGCLNSEVNAWFNPTTVHQGNTAPPYGQPPKDPVSPQSYETKDPYQPPRY